MFKLHAPTGKAIGIITSLLLIAFMVSTIQRQPATNAIVPVKTEQEVKYTKLLKECLADKRHCEGGYIQRSAGPIYRIRNCGYNCNPYEMGLDSIESKMLMRDPWLPADLKMFAPHSDKEAWDKATIDYAEQFVVK